MYCLLSNKAIKEIDLDNDKSSTTGQIYFENGEIYIGEVINNLPKGQGKLILNDNSFYSGDFNGKSIRNGVFRHFTGLVFSGEFSNGKWKKGKVFFPDGDKLKGMWAAKRKCWMIKKGNLFDEEDLEVGSI